MAESGVIAKAACVQAAATLLIAKAKPPASIDAEMIAKLADEIYKEVWG